MLSGAIYACTIPNNRLPRHLGISNALLKGVLQTQDYIFTKLPLITNDIGNIPGKKGLLFAEGRVRDAEDGPAAGFFGSIY